MCSSVLPMNTVVAYTGLEYWNHFQRRTTTYSQNYSWEYLRIHIRAWHNVSVMFNMVSFPCSDGTDWVPDEGANFCLKEMFYGKYIPLNMRSILRGAGWSWIKCARWLRLQGNSPMHSLEFAIIERPGRSNSLK